jgi:hypothetical protein
VDFEIRAGEKEGLGIKELGLRWRIDTGICVILGECWWVARRLLEMFPATS